MRHRVLLWPLIVLLPFAGIRMVCVELPETHSVSAARSQARCTDSCPIPKPRDPHTPVHDTNSRTGCLLFADGSLHLLVSGPAVLPAQAPVLVSFVARQMEPADACRYQGPALTQGTPPPRT